MNTSVSSRNATLLLRISCLIWLLAIDVNAAVSANALSANRLLKEPLPLALQVRIRQCRQRCYQQTLAEQTPPALCRSRPDCYMCHDYCRVLVIAEWSLAAAMCADRNFCSRGCRTACQFHRHYTTSKGGD
ncbi:uncharacterized protein LOC117577992 [Drosophila albomicans]|uniref:Uncharacterized protein LOC117577992 n=1 Tax=Drosophila albomicans TaxID=7291 RepID=A0A6P8Y672_DROAB|nr:uncharacterized protein LOC117577992 [Drosophila albomicans]